MLDEAERRSQDRTPIGRHVATIMLDGACEYAMGLAAAELGVPAGRDANFHATYKRLIATRIGAGWAAGSWKGVSELHGSRNMAQHEGTPVATDGLLRWSIDAGSFVRSLCRATFSVELHDLSLADAIVTPDVRALLLEAEKALDTYDGDRAFARAMAGFDEARAQWRAQRADAHGPDRATTMNMTPVMGIAAQFGPPQIDPIQDFVEVLPFAPDVGEYYWLLARRSEFEDPERPDATPSIEEATRAFRFAFFWSLRWEAFAVGYTWRRWSDRSPYEPPSSGRTGGPPLIWGLRGVEGARPRVDRDPVFTIELQLADLPSVHRGEWAGFLHRKLNELSPKDDFGSQIDYPRITEDGLLYLMQIPGDRDGEELVARVHRAIAESQAEFEAFLTDEEDWNGKHEQLLEPYERALAAVTFEQTRPLFGLITAHGRTHDFAVTGDLVVEDDGWIQHDVLGGIARHVGGYDGDVRYDDADRRLTFRSSLTPVRAAELAYLIGADIATARTERAAAQGEIDAIRERLEGEVRRAITARLDGPPAQP